MSGFFHLAFSRSIHVLACIVFYFFIQLNDIASYGYILHFVYSFFSGWTFGFFHFVAIVTNTALNIYAQAFA